MLSAKVTACHQEPDKNIEVRRLVYRRSLCISAPIRRKAQPQDACQSHGRVSMSALFEPDKDAVRHEHALTSLCDRTGAPLAEVRSLFAQCCVGKARSAQEDSHARPARTNQIEAIRRAAAERFMNTQPREQ
jgi:hypothetical protein